MSSIPRLMECITDVPFLSYRGLIMNRATLSSTLLPLFLAACGGNVVVDGASTLGTGGATTSSSVGAGGASCAAGAVIALVVDNQQVELTASCNLAGKPPVPTGQEVYATDGAGMTGLHIVGCVTSAENSPRLIARASGAFAPGTFTSVEADYYQADGGTDIWGNVGTVQVDQLGPVGGTITGSFQITGPSAALQGTFVVCRVPDSPFTEGA